MELKRNSKLIDRKYKEYFVPTLLMAMSTSMSIIVDGIIVGNLLGAMALAAVNVCMPIMQMFTAIAVLIGMGAATSISIAKGKRDDRTANQIFTTMAIMILIISVLLLLCQLFNISAFCKLLTSSAELYPYALDYYRILACGTPFIIMVLAFVYVVRSDGLPKLASLVLIASNVVNLLMDVILIKVFNMGIKGSACATVIGYIVGLILLGYYFFSKNRSLVLDFGEIWLRIKDIISSGFSPAIGGILVTIKILCINHIVTNIAGSSGMVSFSVCISCLSFVSMFISGASQTMMPILGTFYGQKDSYGVRMVIRRAFIVLTASSVSIICFLEILPKLVLKIFGITQIEDLLFAVPAIRIFAISLFGSAMVFLAMFICTAIQKKELSLLITVLEGFVIVVPAAYILSGLVGINGVWLAFIFAEYGTLAVLYFVIKRKPLGILKNPANSDSILEISVSKNNVSDMVDKTISFLKKEGLSESLSNRIGITIEEMIENISKFSKKISVNMDVLIRKDESGVVLFFCDDGLPFNPLYFNEEEKKDYSIDNITMITAIATNIEYQRVIGLNRTIISIKSEVLQ